MEKGCIYHVYNRGISDVHIFKNRENYRFFLMRYRHYVSAHAMLLAYCLMPTHFHFLILARKKHNFGRVEDSQVSPPSGSLDNAFRKLFISYAKAFNRMYGRHGALFQESYKRKPVLGDRQFANTLAYIHYNPVAAKLSDSMDSWPFSSYMHYEIGESSLISTSLVLDWFGGKNAFFSFHDKYRLSKEDPGMTL